MEVPTLWMVHDAVSDTEIDFMKSKALRQVLNPGSFFTKIFCPPTFPAHVPHGGIQIRTDVAFCFMPGVKHQSRLIPVAPAAQLKTATQTPVITYRKQNSVLEHARLA
jgi:hypothetical protein